MKNTRKIAIIGIGPRGGFAFEKLVEKLIHKNSLKLIHIVLFEQTKNMGNGPVYDLHQNSSNWINITERILELPRRELLKYGSISIDEFPSYHQWAFPEKTFTGTEVDTYPPRSKMGEYLSQRLDSLTKPLLQEGLLTIINQRADLLQWQPDGKVTIKTDKSEFNDLDEVLLTIGHQPTKDDNQIKEWEQFNTENEHVYLFKEAYPTENYLQHKALTANSTIGIRGFGLAMIDATRAIALNFGKFVLLREEDRRCKYVSNTSVINLIVPFSLDGLPPVPKPLNAGIDQWFKPDEEALLHFKKTIGDKKNQQQATSTDFLLDAFTPIASAIFTSLPKRQVIGSNTHTKIENIIKLWLKDQTYQHWAGPLKIGGLFRVQVFRLTGQC